MWQRLACVSGEALGLKKCRDMPAALKKVVHASRPRRVSEQTRRAQCAMGVLVERIAQSKNPSAVLC
jgi:hypothetical protein